MFKAIIEDISKRENSNDFGELGVGAIGGVAVPTLVNLDGVVDIVTEDCATWFLTEKGELYVAGKAASMTYVSPTLIDTGVSRIGWVENAGSYCYYYTVSGHLKYHGSSYGNNLFVLY